MTELVVLSGKGGTGKTSVTASLAALAEAPVLADCDVDASICHWFWLHASSTTGHSPADYELVFNPVAAPSAASAKSYADLMPFPTMNPPTTMKPAHSGWIPLHAKAVVFALTSVQKAPWK